MRKKRCSVAPALMGNIRSVIARAHVSTFNSASSFFSHMKTCFDLFFSSSSFSFQGYKRKTEAAKKEYLKALAAYRASLVSKVTLQTHRPRLRPVMDWMENPC